MTLVSFVPQSNCTQAREAPPALQIVSPPRGAPPGQLRELLSQKASATTLRSADIHFFDAGPQTLQYLLVVDALNFCFWPDEDLEYEQLAKGLKVWHCKLAKNKKYVSLSKSAVWGPQGPQAIGQAISYLLAADS